MKHVLNEVKERSNYTTVCDLNNHLLSWTFFIQFGKQTPNFNQNDLDQTGISRTAIVDDLAATIDQ
ncbi:MAG TPA: hypothetical protein ENH10_06870 [Bacteroidetes bacterium]|nr:hypothetical protein [Bacteroidota bacterium]HEX04864.1 hypothetical protein [Bacteroidota bacterium]